MASKKARRLVANRTSGRKAQTYVTLTLGHVRLLADSLLDLSDRYPAKFVTEIDFYPLVVAYLSWKFPRLWAEYPLGDKGRIDFKIHGTTNPAYLELAVARRVSADPEVLLALVRGVLLEAAAADCLDDDDVNDAMDGLETQLRDTSGLLKIPRKTQLAASSNESELHKLSQVTGAGRFLLLLDLRRDEHDFAKLKRDYLVRARKVPGKQRITVVYAHRSKRPRFEKFIIK